LEGSPPKFPLTEGLNILQAIRYVALVTPLVHFVSQDTLPDHLLSQAEAWLVDEASNNLLKRSFCERHSLDYTVIQELDL